MIPPGQRAEALRYRTFWKRFWAGLLDGIVMIPLSWILAPLVRPPATDASILTAAAIGAVVPVIYSVLMHAARGQTLGKMATGVEVLDVGESDLPTMGQAVRRDIGNIVLAIAQVLYLASQLEDSPPASLEEARAASDVTLVVLASGWFLLEIVTMLSNPKRRALHDLIAGTVVVRKEHR